MSHNLVMRSAIAVLAVFLLASTWIAPPSAVAEGQDDTLCKSQPGRVTVASDFVLDACFDGTYLVIRNRKELVVRVNRVGSPGQGELAPVGGVPSPAAGLMELLHSTEEPDLLPPNYQLKIPVLSSDSGSVEIVGIKDYQTQYVLAKGLTSAFDLGGQLTAISESVVELNRSLIYAWSALQKCGGDRAGYWARLACDANYSRDIAVAVGKFSTSLVGKVGKVNVSGVRRIVDTTEWTNSAIGDFSAFIKGTRRITVDESSVATPPGQVPPPAPSAGDISLSPATGPPGRAIRVKTPATVCPPFPAGDSRRPTRGTISLLLVSRGHSENPLWGSGGSSIEPDGTLIDYGKPGLTLVPYVNQQYWGPGAYPTLEPGDYDVIVRCETRRFDENYYYDSITREYPPIPFKMEPAYTVTPSARRIERGKSVTVTPNQPCPQGSDDVSVHLKGQYTSPASVDTYNVPVQGNGSWRAQIDIPKDLYAPIGGETRYTLWATCQGADDDAPSSGYSANTLEYDMSGYIVVDPESQEASTAQPEVASTTRSTTKPTQLTGPSS